MARQAPRVRPGLTGLWQVRARHSTSFDERLRFDIAYVDACSFRLDLQILLATVLSVVRRTGV